MQSECERSGINAHAVQSIHLSQRQRSNIWKLEEQPFSRERFEQKVKSIVDIVCEVTMQEVGKRYMLLPRERINAQLGKICSKCTKKYKGPYYQCLRCQNYILCPRCYPNKQAHHSRNHPFGVIQTFSQTIIKKSVKTINVEDIPYQQYQQGQNYEDLPSESEGEIIQQLRQQLYKLILKSPNISSQAKEMISTQTEKKQPVSQEGQSQMEIRYSENLLSSNHKEKKQEMHKQQSD